MLGGDFKFNLTKGKEVGSEKIEKVDCEYLLDR